MVVKFTLVYWLAQKEEGIHEMLIKIQFSFIRLFDRIENMLWSVHHDDIKTNDLSHLN